MPSSFSCVEVSEKRAFQSGILALCEESLRPMRLRKVFTSGTKGVGDGSGWTFTF